VGLTPETETRSNFEMPVGTSKKVGAMDVGAMGPVGVVMAGLGLFVQKNAIAATTPISTAVKFCIRNRKKWAPESTADRS
jgi:hypothetical protein